MATNDSTQLRTSRYVQGGTTERTETALEWWERKKFSTATSDISYTVEKYYEGRMDLIAYAFYDEPRYWWIIAQYNSILDPALEIVEGRYLRIPTLERVRTEFLTGRVGGVDSKRELTPQIKPITR